MSSEPGNAATPLSIFISYASADRPQARLLGETLTKAGLDVWFDEEELAGGEAWDSKIRQQIRACTYFMPVISATTEARREGYFRREWRLAVERTLDLADDVTFLVPVAIDDTRDYGARVPEKFTSVQWLRCPGGRETPQLLALARRLAGHHTPPLVATPTSPPPPLATPPKTSRAAAREAAPLRPFPVFPPFPAAGHRARFLYELVVWAGHMIHAFWVRLPRWLRLIATVVIVFKAINFGFHSVTTDSSDEDEAAKKAKTAVAAKLGQALSKAGDAEDDAADPTVQKILQATGAAVDALQGGRPLAVIPFATTDRSLQGPALKAFSALHGSVVGSGHEKQVAVGITPLLPGFTDTDALARATNLKCRWLLAGVASPEADGTFKLAVKLYDTADRTVIWQASRSGAIADAAKLGEALATELRSQIPLDPPAAP
jgi:hypothetical protein